MICSRDARRKGRIGLVENGFALKLAGALKKMGLSQK
jgi:hypothetical protein